MKERQPLSSRSSHLKGETDISGLCSISKGLKVLRGDVVADMNETDTNSIPSKEAAGPSGKNNNNKKNLILGSFLVLIVKWQEMRSKKTFKELLQLSCFSHVRLCATP